MIQVKWPTYKFSKAQKPTAAYTSTGLHHYTKEEVHYLLDAVQMDFESMPWDVIKSIVDQGLAESFFALGDTKTVMGKNNQEKIFRIIDFGHYAEGDVVIEEADGLKNAIVWNNGESDEDNTANDYKISYIRTYVNSLLSSQYPDDLQVVISKTSYQVAKNGKSGAPLVTLTDKLFLGAEKEYFGVRSYSMEVESSALSQFALYATQSKIKTGGNDSNPVIYWERSPSPGGPSIACFVTASGTAGNGMATYSHYLSPIFTIKPSV